MSLPKVILEDGFSRYVLTEYKTASGEMRRVVVHELVDVDAMGAPNWVLSECDRDSINLVLDLWLDEKFPDAPVGALAKISFACEFEDSLLTVEKVQYPALARFSSRNPRTGRLYRMEGIGWVLEEDDWQRYVTVAVCAVAGLADVELM